MEELLKLASNYGFPIVVAGFLLFRMEKTIQSLRDEIIQLRQNVLQQLKDEVVRLREIIDIKYHD